MKELPNNSIDLIVTDPPYGIKYQSNMRKKTEKFSLLENDDNDLRFLVYSEMFRVLKDNSCCIVFASWKNFSRDYTELEKYFSIKNTIIWFKRGGGIGDLKHSLLTDYEIAIVCHKGKCPIRGKREGSVWEIKKVNSNKMKHPTEKPTELIERLIEKFSNEGDVVLDPFLGSGTTAVASINTKRNFIGFELSKEYFDIAEKRIQECAFFNLHKRSGTDGTDTKG
jgi:site-specific DNA-methyltransferase (adenine-specific)